MVKCVIDLRLKAFRELVDTLVSSTKAIFGDFAVLLERL
jgi:hypothetical protein